MKVVAFFISKASMAEGPESLSMTVLQTAIFLTATRWQSWTNWKAAFSKNVCGDSVYLIRNGVLKHWRLRVPVGANGDS